VRLYLDDNLASQLLGALLRGAGHNVEVPADVGLGGRRDAVHFAHAVRDDRVILSQNYGDFEDLRDLIATVQAHHPGILNVRQDNDPQRGLTPRGL
jgi:predicted nuclease of predicted toxin-antitoxin system